MKIKSCYIEGFGTFHRQKFEFADLHVICEENGYGKTTLATFIKAMFFGLPEVRTNSNFNDREHFYPFSRGRFGGNIIFEYEGQEYKIERFFDKKSSNKDDLKVYKNSVLTEEFGDLIGKSIFGLDEDSFYRTIFISSDAIELASTSSINEKLNNFVNNTNKTTSYEQAIKLLNEKQKKYNAKNKGLIDIKKKAIKDKGANLANLYRMRDSLSTVYKQYDDSIVEKDRLNQELSELRDRKLELEKWAVYDEYLTERDNLIDRFDIITNQYPNGIPYQEILEAEKYKKAVDLRKLSLGNLLFKEENRQQLNNLQEIFKDKIPSKVEFEQIQTDIDQYNAKNIHFQTLFSKKISERNTLLIDRFRSKEPTIDELNNNNQTIAEYKKYKERRDAINQTISSENVETVKSSNLPALVILGISIVLIISGILLISTGIIYAVIVWVFAFASMILSAFLYFKNKILSVSAQQKKTDPRIEEINIQLVVIEKQINLFLMKYSYISDNGIVSDFKQFETDYQEYLDFKDQQTIDREELSKTGQELKRLQSSLDTFFRNYQIVGSNYQSALIELNRKVDSYSKLKKDFAEYNSQRDSIISDLTNYETLVTEIFNKYNLDVNNIDYIIDEVKKDKIENDQLIENIRSLELKAEKFKQDKKLSVKPENYNVDDELINERENQLNSMIGQLSSLEKQIRDHEMEIEKIGDDESELEKARKLLNDYQEIVVLLDKTIESLEKAEQNLKNNFIKPIKDRFSYYSEKIEKFLGKKIVMDEDCHIMVEIDGVNRKDGHLSSGQRSVISLCLRLALIDNMYIDRSPFIIMDDPFVNLDDKHMNETLSLVKEMAKYKQIIYFCCHPSRKIS